MDSFAENALEKAAPGPPGFARSRSFWFRIALLAAVAAGAAIFVYEAFIFSYPYRYSDFVVYYAAARVAADGGNPYERTEIGNELSQLGIDSNIQEYLYSSPFLVAMQPLLLLSVREAHRVFMVLSFLALIASMLLLWRTLNQKGGRIRAPAWLVGVMLLWFAPVWSNLTLTQANDIVLLLLCVCFYLAAKKRDFWAGVALAGALLLKLTPALLLLYFLLRRRWHALAGTAIAVAVLELASLVYFRKLLDAGLPGAVLEQGPRKLLYWSNVSFPAMLAHPFGSESRWVGPVSLTAGAIICAVTVWLAWKRRKAAGTDGLVFSLLVTTFLLSTTYVYEHHLIFLLIPLAVIAALLLGPLSTLPRAGLAVLGGGMALTFLMINLDYWRLWVWFDMESRGWWAHPATWGLLLLWVLQMGLLMSRPVLQRLGTPAEAGEMMGT